MPQISARGSLTEADLLPVARYATWNRSAATKVLFSLGCFLVLLGVVNLFIGQSGNAVVPILLGLSWTLYLFLAPKLSIKKQLKSAAHVSQEGTYEFGDAEFNISRPS